jgi:Protein of unknown function (DUF1091)
MSFVRATPFQLHAKLVFEVYEAKRNPLYDIGNSSISNSTGRSTVSIDYEILRKLDLKFFVKLDVFKLLPKLKLRVVPVPKLNYCTLIRGTKDVPFLSVVLNSITSFLTMSLACPIKPGRYRLENYYIDESKLLLLPVFGNARYMMQAVFTDENGKNVVHVVTITTIFSYTKENKLSLL